MTKSPEKRRASHWNLGDVLTDQEFQMVRYATRSMLLQERVPLTFVEARIYLHEEKPESLEDIAERFDIPLERIREVEPIIRKKVEDAEKQREVFFGHGPIFLDDKGRPIIVDGWYVNKKK